MLRISFAIAVLFIGLQSAAQNGFNIRNYSTENGMPSNGIKGMQWDEETGFLWVATEAGVARFNGIQFKLFTSENIPSMRSNRISFLVRNNKNRIIAVEGAKNVLEVRTNGLFFLRQYVKTTDYNKISWIAASEQLFDHETNTREQYRFYLPFDNLINIDDTSCYFHQNGQVYYCNLSFKKKVDFPNIKRVDRMFKIGTGYFIKDEQNRMFRLTSEALDLVTLVTDNGKALNLAGKANLLYWENGMPNPILFEDGNAWLLKWEKEKILAHQVANNVPPATYIRYAQYSEKMRTLFIGTDSKGFMVISENNLIPMKKKGTGINEKNAYYAQIPLADGNVLTNEGHIIGEAAPGPSKIPIRPFVFSAYQTNDSLIWYEAIEGSQKYAPLHRVNRYTGQVKIYDHLSAGSVNALCSSADRIYLAKTDGFGYLEGETMHYIFSKDQWNIACSGMIEARPGVLLLGSCTGLLRFDTRTEKLDTLFKTRDYCIRTMWKYGDYIFLGTYGNGFIVWKDGVAKRLPLDKNKYLLYSHCFIRDSRGFCWISTNRGLFKVSTNDLINAYEHPTDQIYYHYFGKNDGMDITEMNGGCEPCAIRLKNGVLSFPTMDGLVWVDPERSNPSLPGNSLYLDEFIVDKVPFSTESGGRQELPSRSSEILIRLGFGGWCNKENIYIDYRLNEEENWQPLSDNDATIRFNRLPSGSYKLQIRKFSGFGLSNYVYKDIRFTISTPWYRQWWFYALCILVIAGAVYFAFRWRIRHHRMLQQKLERQVEEKTKELSSKNEALEKADNIKTRLISIISHDIVTPLKFVTVAGKNLIEKRKQMPEELQNEALEEITNTSQELQLLSTNILNWIKYQNKNRRLVKEDFNTSELVDSVFGVLRSIANQKNIQLLNNVNRNLVIHQYYEPLKILIYNLVSNAINFSERGNITVSNHYVEGVLVLAVQDEGMGMTEEQIKNLQSNQVIISSANKDNRKGHGLGYLIIKDLIKLLDASIDISSARDHGTTISLSIPHTQVEEKDNGLNA